MKKVCRKCNVERVAKRDEELNQWYYECPKCGSKLYPNLLRGIFG